jgi:hypothetical protein
MYFSGRTVWQKPAWTRYANGQDPQGNPVIIGIPAPCYLRARTLEVISDNHAIIDIPADALPANIDLAELVDIYRG